MTRRPRVLPFFWYIDTQCHATCRSRRYFRGLACLALVLLAPTQIVQGQLAGSSAAPAGAFSSLHLEGFLPLSTVHILDMLRIAGTTTVSMITAKNDSASCLQGCYNGDCGAGTDNYVALTACDERLSQLWLMSTVNRDLINVASGYCLSITSDNVVVMAGCGNNSPAQTWTLYANDTLEPQSNPGSSLSVCTSGASGCNAKIIDLFSNDGQLITLANNTSEAAALGTWEQLAPSK